MEQKNITWNIEKFEYSENAEKILGTKDGDLDKVLKVYQISRSTMETMIAGIQEWYSKQPHLPQGQLHDRMILGHLIARAFRVEQCKEHIDNYFSARHKMPDMLCGWSPGPHNLLKYLKTAAWIGSPYPTSENHRVIILRIPNPADFSVHDVMSMGMMVKDYMMFNDLTIGEHWIVDFTNSDFNIIRQYTPLLLAKIYYYYTNCYAQKLKGMHFVGLPSVAHSVLAVFKKLIKEKHSSRIRIYKTFEEVFDVLPRESFPKDLGGTADFTCDEWGALGYETYLKSDNWRAFFANQQKYFYSDESKRLSPTKGNDAFGVDGSFRTLELD